MPFNEQERSALLALKGVGPNGYKTVRRSWD